MPALIQILLTLAIAGVILWALAQIPMDDAIRKIIRVVIIAVIAIWLLMLLAALIGYGPPVFPYYRR